MSQLDNTRARERAIASIDPLEVSRRETILDRVSHVFTPSSPIRERELFAGREAQIADLKWVIRQAGRHGVIYGERGVGKTSLATHLEELVRSGDEKAVSTTVTCRTGNDFSELWIKAFRGLGLLEPVIATGFAASGDKLDLKAQHRLGADQLVTPDTVADVLLTLGRPQPTVIFFDEFDRIADRECRRELVDLIKLASDRALPTTLVLVAVADSIDELIREHESVERVIDQVLMPRMSREELRQIVRQGLDRLNLAIEHDALDRIVNLSQGVPHFTHLLAQEAVKDAADAEEFRLSMSHVETATLNALRHTEQSIRRLYARAVGGPQPGRYPEVLLSAALCNGDELGSFSPADVQLSLEALTGKRRSTHFGRHLNALCTPERGQVLQKVTELRGTRYRFANPLLQPYVVIRGCHEGRVSDGLLARVGESSDSARALTASSSV